jgi:hypothetical protein
MAKDPKSTTMGDFTQRLQEKDNMIKEQKALLKENKNAIFELKNEVEKLKQMQDVIISDTRFHLHLMLQSIINIKKFTGKITIDDIDKSIHLINRMFDFKFKTVEPKAEPFCIKNLPNTNVNYEFLSIEEVLEKYRHLFPKEKLEKFREHLKEREHQNSFDDLIAHLTKKFS